MSEDENEYVPFPSYSAYFRYHFFAPLSFFEKIIVAVLLFGGGSKFMENPGVGILFENILILVCLALFYRTGNIAYGYGSAKTQHYMDNRGKKKK
jgi:hypothetical protein